MHAQREGGTHNDVYPWGGSGRTHEHDSDSLALSARRHDLERAPADVHGGAMLRYVKGSGETVTVSIAEPTVASRRAGKRL